MKMIRIPLFIIIMTLCLQQVYAQVYLADNNKGANKFALVLSDKQVRLYYDQQDFEVVKKTTKILVEDIKMVTGKTSEILSINKKLSDNSVVIGTLGKNKLIDQWAKEGKIKTQELIGKWESYSIQVVQNPAAGLRKVLVVVGSDRRGTAYGVFTLSELIGVSPWYWWADVPVKKHSEIYLNVKPFVSKSPSVKYRGLFINDEDWGLLPWAKKTFETDRKTIGPKTYAKVCELLLRLKANYLCPAMHEATVAFNKIPENKLVADSFAIVMGSVHCEPLLFNNASEWDKKTMGEWDYINNNASINKVLKDRVKSNAPFENVYTLALRGLHDRAMAGSNKMDERVKMVGEALMDQRKILEDVIGEKGNQIPQAFTPYKEVLDLYTNGLALPDDVTIVWPDDNYGYLKQLSSPAEQKRSGRSGVYYHASYLGKPHDYLWISSTSPALMYEELSKAYKATADRIWLLNAGDIKSCELPVNLFLQMAYDIDAFNYDNIATYHAQWLSSMYGSEHYNDLLNITQTYYHLAFSRKPEFMGWGYEWNTNKHGRERTTDTDFSLSNYREADHRIAEYCRIGASAENIMRKLDDQQKASFYQLLFYPVKGAELMNKMHLLAQKNKWYALQGRSATNKLKTQVKACYDSLQLITNGYNSLLNGKWNYIMSMRQGVTTSYFEHPKVDSIQLKNTAALGIVAEGEDILKGAKSFHSLPSFNTYLRKAYYFDIYNKGAQPLQWKLNTSDSWIVINQKSGSSIDEERIWVTVDWDKVPVGEKILGTIEVVTGDEKENIFVSVFNPASPAIKEMDSLFVEDNGCISINAANFHRKNENDQIQIKLIPNLGFENKSIQLGDPVAPLQNPRSSIVPSVEYDFYTFQRGSVDVYTYALPTFPLYSDRDYAGHESSNIETKYGVCIDDGPVMTPTTSSFEYAQAWYENVLKNCAIKKTTLHINQPGKHSLKILCGDPGLVIQKIVLDFGGMKRSYLGPQPTQSFLK